MGNSITFFVFVRVQLSKEKARQQTLIIIGELSFNASTLSSLVQVFNPNYGVNFILRDKIRRAGRRGSVS